MTVENLIAALQKANPQAIVIGETCVIVNALYNGATVTLTDGSENLDNYDDLQILNME